MGDDLIEVIDRPKKTPKVFLHKVERLSQLDLTSIGVDYTASYEQSLSSNVRLFIDNLREADHLILEGPESRMKFLTIDTLVQSYEALTYNLHENDDPYSNFWLNLSRKAFKPLSLKPKLEDILKPEDFASFRNSKIHYLTDGFNFIKLGEKYGFNKEKFTTYYALTIFNLISMVEEKAKINDPVKIANPISNFSEKNTFKTMLTLVINHIPGWNGKPSVDETADRLIELVKYDKKEEEKSNIVENNQERKEEKPNQLQEMPAEYLLRKYFTQHFFRDIRNYEIIGPRMKELIPSLEGKKVVVLGLANLNYSILSLLGEQKEKPKQWEEVIQNLSEKEQELIYSVEEKLFHSKKLAHLENFKFKLN